MSKSMSAMNVQMKKGFIYRNMDAQTFEAVSHVRVSNGYTGFMPIGANSLQDDFYIVGIEKELQDEYVLRILPSGEIVGKNSLGDKYYSVKDVSLQCKDLLPFPLPYKTDIPPKNIGIISNGKYIAVRERCWEMLPSGNVQIWDCEKMELLATITDEFIVKDFSMTFAGNITDCEKL